jgi:phenylalanyl-tRNA synthetase beta chain
MIGALISQGLNEIVTYSFISPKFYDSIKLPEDSPLRKSVIISNPLGEDTGVMRTTAIPSMLDALGRNYRNRLEEAGLFELATEYLPTGDGEKDLPNEIISVVIGLYGPDADFYTLKGVLEALLEKARVTDWSVEPLKTDPTFHPGRSARLVIAGEDAGVFGQIHPEVAEGYRIEAPVYLARLELEAIMRNGGQAAFKPLPRFPASTRDLALVCPEETAHAQITGAIKISCGKILESCELFDVYRSEQIGEGKKSMAYSLTLRASDRTLTDEECDRAVAKILRALEPLGVTLRS